MTYSITRKFCVVLSLGSCMTLFQYIHTLDDGGIDILDTLDSMLIIDEADVQSILQKRACVDPSDIVEALQAVDLIPLLEENLYLHTNVLNNRSLLDNPLFEPLCIPYTKGWAAGFDFFWNQTNRMNFTWNSNRISSYLALQETSLISKLEEAIDNLTPLFPNAENAVNINNVLALASQVSVEQRRIGFMLHGTRTWDDWRVRFFCPVYYLERNYFLTQAEQDQLAAEFGFDTPSQDTEFQDRFLVSDKLGIGDTRIEFDATVHKNNSSSIRAGLLATIPTAFSFINGLKGHSFKKTACLPPAHLIEDLFCIALSDKSDDEKVAESIALLQVFGLGSLDRLSANLLDTSLGNDGHLGIGILGRFNVDLGSLIWNESGHDFHWKQRISLEYQLPNDEKRFFVEQIDTQAFTSRNFDDTQQADENLAFLEEELVKRFYPVAFDVLVQPGIIFRYDSRLCYQKYNWSLMTGAEFWAQTAAKLKSVDAFGRLANQIDVCKAEASGAVQLSVFGGLSYTLERPKRTWILSLNGDGAVATRGIGKDFTVVFNVETHF